MRSGLTHKSSNIQMFRLMLYRRPLHPELFSIQARSVFRTSEYEVESWLMPAGHVVRFQHQDQTLTETVIESGDHLPETGLVHALPCLGEKEFEMTSPQVEDSSGAANSANPSSTLGYMTTIQTEALSDNLYMATYREMVDFAEETGALMYQWNEKVTGTVCLTILDSEKYKSEYQIQSYHLLGSNGMVLRTQSIFEIL